MKLIPQQSKRNGKTFWTGQMFLVVLLILLAQPQQALAQTQWSTNGNDINNTNSGNVGIGTSSPACKLDVNGAIQATGLSINASSSDTPVIIKPSTANVSYGTRHNLFELRTTTGTVLASMAVWRLGSGSGDFDAAHFYADSFTAVSSTGHVPGFQVWKDSNATKAVFIGMGPVGTLGDDMVFSTYSMGSSWVERARLTNANGNFGIGTPTPVYRLDVQGGQINASGGLCIAGDCKSAWSQVGGGDGSNLTNLNASNITTGTLDNARLGIVPITKGGTGLTSAGVSGNFLRSNGTSFTSTALQGSDLPPLSTYYIQNQTTGPQFGGFNVSSNGTVGGTLSGNTVNATTQYNIGGTRVLSMAGTNNIFGGSGAGNSNSIGTGNSFFGKDAGRGNTTGNDNSFFGNSAGYSNVSGINNSFFGIYAGDNNTSGSNNSFFGYNSGSISMTGSNNTMIGAGAGVGINSLSYATAIGSSAQVNASDTIVLGKTAGNYPGGFRFADTVIVRGWLQLDSLATAGGNSLCWNNSHQVSLCSSSLRYKTNIAPFSAGMDIINRLRPITFRWKDGGMPDLGFGAEDVATVEPLLVTHNSKGQIEGVKYDRITAVLVNAIKQQQEQIKEQQHQLETKDSQIEFLKASVAQQEARLSKIESTITSLARSKDVDKQHQVVRHNQRRTSRRY